jgi:hypothetical protein
MQPASEHHIPDGLLASMTLLSEKPRHGVASRKSAPHPGINEANSTAPIGLRFRCWEIVSGTVEAPSNGISSTYPPNTPKTPDQCSIYNNGTASGSALYKLCQTFPNNPKSNQMRGCLQSLYSPQSGYIPLPVLIPTSPGSMFDLNSLIPGTGAHLNCAVGTLGGGS